MHIKNSIKLINNDVKKNPITATSIADGIDAVAKVITKPNMLEIIAPTVLGTNKQLSSKQSQSFEQNILNIIASNDKIPNTNVTYNNAVTETKRAPKNIAAIPIPISKLDIIVNAQQQVLFF